MSDEVGFIEVHVKAYIATTWDFYKMAEYLQMDLGKNAFNTSWVPSQK